MEQLKRRVRSSRMRLGPDSRFTFRCHKDVKCFTQCCRGINIILTPYDIIRLKNRLGLSSEEFLAVYTEPQMLEKTDIPVVTLKLLDEEGAAADKKACPFVRPGGLPGLRGPADLLPLLPAGGGLARLQGRPGRRGVLLHGARGPLPGVSRKIESWTVLEWRQDQGVDVHDRINAQWTDLIVRKRSFPPNMHWTEQAKQMFFMASYNIDKFRTFVFESSFLKRYPSDAATLEKTAQRRRGPAGVRAEVAEGAAVQGGRLQDGGEKAGLSNENRGLSGITSFRQALSPQSFLLILCVAEPFPVFRVFQPLFDVHPEEVRDGLEDLRRRALHGAGGLQDLGEAVAGHLAQRRFAAARRHPQDRHQRLVGERVARPADHLAVRGFFGGLDRHQVEERLELGGQRLGLGLRARPSAGSTISVMALGATLEATEITPAGLHLGVGHHLDRHGVVARRGW
ncbi:MAG: hypothetical protein MZV70_56220 [Desulfobacterales bacterium]|nr:hypothetical protein [Desulfobacterales bacterium]